jgi:hypothetical protein
MNQRVEGTSLSGDYCLLSGPQEPGNQASLAYI